MENGHNYCPRGINHPSSKMRRCLNISSIVAFCQELLPVSFSSLSSVSPTHAEERFLEFSFFFTELPVSIRLWNEQVLGGENGSSVIALFSDEADGKKRRCRSTWPILCVYDWFCLCL
jgi:hypothetical protein